MGGTGTRTVAKGVKQNGGFEGSLAGAERVGGGGGEMGEGRLLGQNTLWPR